MMTTTMSVCMFYFYWERHLNVLFVYFFMYHYVINHGYYYKKKTSCTLTKNLHFCAVSTYLGCFCIFHLKYLLKVYIHTFLYTRQIIIKFSYLCLFMYESEEKRINLFFCLNDMTLVFWIGHALMFFRVMVLVKYKRKKNYSMP